MHQTNRASIKLTHNRLFLGGIGGRGGTYEKRLSSMESLDLSDRQPKWQLMTPMSTPRSSHTVETLNGLIYVVGGGDGREWLNSAEVFDPKRNKWAPIASLKIKRWKCGLVALGGYLYALGGMDSPQAGSWGSPLNSVERYSPSKTFYETLKISLLSEKQNLEGILANLVKDFD